MVWLSTLVKSFPLNILLTISIALGPLSLIMAIAPTPRDVEIDTIVSSMIIRPFRRIISHFAKNKQKKKNLIFLDFDNDMSIRFFAFTECRDIFKIS